MNKVPAVIRLKVPVRRQAGAGCRIREATVAFSGSVWPCEVDKAGQVSFVTPGGTKLSPLPDQYDVVKYQE